MRAAGLAVRVWEPEPAELPPSRYPIPAGHHFRGRPQLLATASGAGGGRTLLFNGHVDVVSAEPQERWTSDPFTPELRQGRLYGRGACDMKGGVAAMLVATEVLRALDVPLARRPGRQHGHRRGVHGRGLARRRRVGGPRRRRDHPGAHEPGGLARRARLADAGDHGRRPRGPRRLAARPLERGGPVNAIEKMQLVLEALQRLRDEWQLRPDTRHEVLAPGGIVPTASRRPVDGVVPAAAKLGATSSTCRPRPTPTAAARA